MWTTRPLPVGTWLLIATGAGAWNWASFASTNLWLLPVFLAASWLLLFCLSLVWR